MSRTSERRARRQEKQHSKEQAERNRRIALGIGAGLVAVGGAVVWQYASSHNAEAPYFQPSGTENIPQLKRKIIEHLSAASEDQMWDQAVKMAPEVYNAYCILYRGCLYPDHPEVKVFDWNTIANRAKEVNPEHRAVPEAFRFNTKLISIPGDGRRVLVNREETVFQRYIQRHDYASILSMLPALELHEFFHRDITEQRDYQSNLEGPEKKPFNQVSGFAPGNRESGLSFVLLEEASAVAVTWDSMKKLQVGIPDEEETLPLGKLAKLLLTKMAQHKMGIQELVDLHRQSDLDGLLAKLYPELSDKDKRLERMLNEFKANYTGQLENDPSRINEKLVADLPLDRSSMEIADLLIFAEQKDLDLKVANLRVAKESILRSLSQGSQSGRQRADLQTIAMQIGQAESRKMKLNRASELAARKARAAEREAQNQRLKIRF